MLRITTAAYEMVGVAQTEPSADADEWSSISLSKDQTKQFVTLYQSLQEFDDEAAQARITCPRLCFVGSADEIQYGENWGNVFVSLAAPIVHGQVQLTNLGWNVYVLDVLDKMQDMQEGQVVPMLRSWLITILGS